ncbi:unnamed protein product [Diamesa hyperborea]
MENNFYYDNGDSSYGGSIDYEDEFSEPVHGFDSLKDVFFNCIFITLKQVLVHIIYLMGINFIYRIIVQYLPIPNILKHIVVAVLGYLSTHLFFDHGNFYFYLLVLLTFGFLYFLKWMQIKKQGLIVTIFTLALVMTCELLEKDSNIWHQVRGPALIISMKVISLAFDISSTKVTELPPAYEYCSYMLCPANCVLGPWCSFEDYIRSHRQSKISLKLISQVCLNGFLALIFVVFSNCIISYIIRDDYILFVPYRDALTFRTSHYFISFMSATMVLIAGIEEAPNKCSTTVLGFHITRPFDIEFPRSLVPVVVSWNIPMHLWLKNYIFHNLKHYGTFIGILSTYVISSALHGLNFQLCAVLLSIGIFTFVEYKLRAVLADVLNACIGANKCRISSKNICTSKNHKHTSNVWWVLSINFIFAVVTILHLAYLGVMFEASFKIQEEGFSWLHTLKKWSDLKFFGHITILIWFIIYLILAN